MDMIVILIILKIIFKKCVLYCIIILGDDMKKGFTLLELLAVIAVIALIGGVSISMFSTSTDTSSEEDLANKFKEIQEAAIVYVDLNDSWLSSFTNGNEIYVRLGELQNTNYISGNIKDPLTGTDFPSDYLIKIYKVNPEESNSYVDSCIISKVGSDTKCIANSDGYACECCDYELNNTNNMNIGCNY